MPRKKKNAPVGTDAQSGPTTDPLTKDSISQAGEEER